MRPKWFTPALIPGIVTAVMTLLISGTTVVHNYSTMQTNDRVQTERIEAMDRQHKEAVKEIKDNAVRATVDIRFAAQRDQDKLDTILNRIMDRIQLSAERIGKLETRAELQGTPRR